MVIQNNDGCAIAKLSKPSYPYMLIGPLGISAIWKYFKEAWLPPAQQLREALKPCS